MNRSMIKGCMNTAYRFTLDKPEENCSGLRFDIKIDRINLDQLIPKGQQFE
jgi:hypothetical protein